MAERVFNLPDLGEGLEEAEIVEWKVAEGDVIELNQPLVDVNTAKALVEIPSPWAGTVVTLHGADADVVKVGEPLITLEVDGEDEPAAEPAGTAEAEPAAAKREAVLVGYGVDQDAKASRRRRLRPPGPRTAPAVTPAPAPSAPAAPTAPAGKPRTTPPVRKLARELGVDLGSVHGTGPEGRVTREDVAAAGARSQAGVASSGGPVPAPAPTAARFSGPEERVPIKGVRRMIFEKMARSWAEVPHVTTFHLADATWVQELRRELTDESGVKVTALPIVVRALVEVCAGHPKLNAIHDAKAGELVLKRDCHVGIATDTEQGLVVPVVRDAQAKGIVTIAAEIAGLVEAARSRRASPDQLTGGTLTVTNVGTFGSDYGTPIINVPEVAILALGTIKPRPLVVNGEIEARPAVTLSLSFDHRFIDGAEADRALTDLRAILESPFRLGALPRA